MVQVAIRAGINLFLLQRLHEPLAASIVIRIARTTHAGHHLVFLQQLYILTARILHSAIGHPATAGAWQSPAPVPSLPPRCLNYGSDSNPLPCASRHPAPPPDIQTLSLTGCR